MRETMRKDSFWTQSSCVFTPQKAHLMCWSCWSFAPFFGWSKLFGTHKGFQQNSPELSTMRGGLKSFASRSFWRVWSEKKWRNKFIRNVCPPEILVCFHDRGNGWSHQKISWLSTANACATGFRSSGFAPAIHGSIVVSELGHPWESKGAQLLPTKKTRNFRPRKTCVTQAGGEPNHLKIKQLIIFDSLQRGRLWRDALGPLDFSCYQPAEGGPLWWYSW